MSEVRAAFERLFSTAGDEMVREYVIGVLEDESFEWGENGAAALDAIGDFLVDGGFVEDSTAAERACAYLASALSKGRDRGVVAFRALENGPMRLSDDPGATVVDEVNVRHLLENPLGNVAPSIGVKDRAKLEKRQNKEEKQQRAALAARQAEMDAAANHIPTIQRNLYALN